MKIPSLLFAAALLFGSACTTNAPTSGNIRQIVSTTSFGMCVGYCSTRLEITAEQAVLVRIGHTGRGGGGTALPEQRIAQPLRPNEWQEIAQLAANTSLNGLPDTIGCPDCADGGAKSLAIVGSSDPRTITFDHGATIPQAQPLLERVRAIRTRMTPPS